MKPADKALSKAARYYIYGRGTVSKSTFEDPAFREMCQAYFDAGGGKGKAPYLTRPGLLKFVDAEFKLLLKFLQFMGQSMLEYSVGNPFLQNLHDAATLEVFINNHSSRVCQ